MREEIEILNRLKKVLEELIIRHERLKEENKTLFEEIQNLKLIIKDKENQIKELNRKLEDYKLGNAFIMAEKDLNYEKRRHQAKLKINKLIRDINYCINMLNIEE